MRRILLFCAGATFALALLAFLGALKTQPWAAPPPEPHPEIRAAMRSLEEAQAHLEHAPLVFGGHRVKALEFTHQALSECRASLEFAERPHH